MPASARRNRLAYMQCMARLRHIAAVVKDLEGAAQCYEKVFDLKRVGEHLEDRGNFVAAHQSASRSRTALASHWDSNPGSASNGCIGSLPATRALRGTDLA